MTQVIDNLLSNAIKFSQRNTNIHVSCSHSSTFVEFRVADQAPGIPKNELEKLWFPFQKLSNRPTAGEGSTGLGLYIVKQFVDAHDGDIFVESEVGRGTTFTVRLPLEPC